MLTRDGDDDYDDKLMMISGHSKVKLEFFPPPFFPENTSDTYLFYP